MVARIVCQVLQRPDRVTFVWSQDDAFFEPYHLDAAETTQFYQAAGRAQQQLARVLTGNDAAKEALARAGHEMYQLIFRTQAGAGIPARKAELWLQHFKDKTAQARGPWVSSVASLEIVSDLPGRIPWNVVYEEPPKNPPDVNAFWGIRYPISSGRRVNPLRLSPFISEPEVLQVLDPSMSAEQLQLWGQTGDAGSRRSVSTRTELIAAMRSRCPDLLCWVGNFACGQLSLGGETIYLSELRDWIDDAEEGSTEPLFLLHPLGEEKGWNDFLVQAALLFPGLITWETPPSVKLAAALEHTALVRLRAGGAPLGQILRGLRQKEGWLGLGLTAFSPPEMFLGELSPDVELVKKRVLGKLPDQPFSPLASLDGESRPLLAGRDRSVFAFAALLDEPGTGLLLLHGSASAGKSSFLQAGVMPYLEKDSVGFLALRDRTEPDGAVLNERDCPIVAVRASKDLAGQLAEALCAYLDQPSRHVSPSRESLTIPFPDLLRQAVNARGLLAPDDAIQKKPARDAITERGTGALELGTTMTSPVVVKPASSPPATAPMHHGSGPVEATELWEALDKDPTLLARLLDSLSRQLPHDLVILIEQGEEIFTQAREPEDAQRRGRALRMLSLAARQVPRCKIIISLRSDYLGRLRGELADNDPDPVAGQTHVRDFCLPELQRHQLLEVLMLPTSTEPIMHTGEVPFNKYRIALNDKFAGDLVDEVLKKAESFRQSPVALIQVVAHKLYERARKRDLKTLDKVDLRIVGGVDDAVRKMVETRLKSLTVSGSMRKHLRLLISGLATSHADGTVTRDSFSMEQVEKAWKGSKLDAEKAVVAAEGAGLVELQNLQIAGQEAVHASLPQDSIARVAQDWVDQKKTNAYAWERVKDALYMMLPLIVLCTVVAWRYGQYTQQPKFEKQEKILEELVDRIRGVRKPKYLADLALAQQAWQDGTIDRMRKILLAHQELPAAADEESDDQRGFEWYYLWHLANSERLALKGHHATVSAVAVSPDGKVCVTASPRGERRDQLFLWDVNTGRKRATLFPDSAVEALVFSSDGKYLVTAGAGKLVQLWDAQAGKDSHEFVKEPKRSLEGHTDTILALACPRIDLPKVETKADPKDAKQEPKKESNPKDPITETRPDPKDAKPESKDAQQKEPAPEVKKTEGPSLLASAGADKKVIIWDLSKDDKDVKLYTLDKHTSVVQALAFAGKGKLASGDKAGALNIWDVGDLKKAPIEAKVGSTIRALAFSPDGKKLLAGGTEPTTDPYAPGDMIGFIRTLDPATGKSLAEAVGKHGTELFALAVSPDGKTIASAGKDNFVRLWNADTMKELGTIKGHLGWINCLAFSPDGYSLVSGSYDSTAKIWRPAPSDTSEILKTGAGPMTCLAMSLDGKFLAAGGKEGNVYVWNIASSRLETTFNLKRPIASLTFGEAEPRKSDAKVVSVNRLAIAAIDAKTKDEPKSKDTALSGEIQVWDIGVENDQMKTTEVFKLAEKFAAAAMSADGKIIAWSEGHNIVRSDLARKEEKGADKGETKPAEKVRKPNLVSKENTDKPFTRLTISPDGTTLAASAEDGVYAWSLETGQELPGSPYKRHKGPILSLAFAAPASTLLLSSGLDRTVRIWKRQKSDSFKDGIFHSKSPVGSLVLGYQHEGELFQADWDHSIKIAMLRFQSKQAEDIFARAPETFTLKGHTGPIRALALSPNYQILASTGDDGTIRLWRAPGNPKE